MKKIAHRDILMKSEQLIEQLRDLAGLISIGNVAHFEMLDSDSYANYMNVLSKAHEQALGLGLEIQNYLYRRNC